MALYALAIDLVLFVHAAFIAFVVAGAALVSRWRALLWWHIAAVLWGVTVEFTGWICPLTLLENVLRNASGRSSDSGGFVARYLLAVIYPDGLTRPIQIMLGAAVLLLNAAIYARIWIRRKDPGRCLR